MIKATKRKALKSDFWQFFINWPVACQMQHHEALQGIRADTRKPLHPVAAKAYITTI